MQNQNSVILSDEILNSIDQIIGRENDRSEFVESILYKYLSERKAKSQRSKDLEIINKNADFLNQEAKDVLDYQVAL